MNLGVVRSIQSFEQGSNVTQTIPPDILHFVAMHVRPCLLLCDGAGCLHERSYAPGCRVPIDVREAAALDACLSRPVRDAWIELVRESICLVRPLEAVVVLDGIGFDLACLPLVSEPSAPRVWLMLCPLLGRDEHLRPDSRRTLRHHEWGHLDALSRSQLDTLRSITFGLSNQQIAERTHRSKRAVEWHIRHLHRLLGAGTRESLARLGRDSGLDRFGEQAWNDVLNTRPARRTLEEYALTDPSRAA